MKYDIPGTYQLTYKAVDECGNETIETRTIEVDSTMTTLYEDGTLIINENYRQRASNIELHGAVRDEYAPLTESNPYNFTGTSQRPWYNDSEWVNRLEFGTPVKPTSLAYWFQTSSLSEIDWTNFDGSECTRLDRFAAGSYIWEFICPPMPKLTTLRYAFRGCDGLGYADFSQTGTKTLNDMQDCFQGCYGLGEVDLSGLEGTVTAADRAFANIAGDGNGDMGIGTIYSTDGLVFAAGNNMFRSCTSLVGGNGTEYSSSKVGHSMAHIDTATNPGYFTAKE